MSGSMSGFLNFSLDSTEALTNVLRTFVKASVSYILPPIFSFKWPATAVNL
ncbi:hypothetical protein GGQ98_000707 [Sphingosinicella soli]|uniref:Uncharacterized protein n=1 Tax=Sphingosinicella soli TaxID=333708 RepID=A0A7W7F575_9SPHN|nr:hypothetical protein [Sphingosinicella soli]